MKAWIQTLSKEQLIAELTELEIEADGDIATLRQRMRAYVTSNPTYGRIRGAHYVGEEVARVSTPTVTPIAVPAAPPPGDAAKTLGQIRKWGVYFDGKDPLGFLEQLEDLCEAAGFTQEALLRGMPAVLKGDALLWHRNNRGYFSSWEDFRQEFTRQFLPPRYQAQLTREILGRQQKPNEPFRTYATEMLTKMRRAREISLEDQLERLYENMSPDYKIYIRRSDARTVGELSSLAAEFEAIEQQRRELRRANEPNVAATYSRDECCWRCKQRGHTRQFCQRPARKFCSQCGKDGVFTKDCHPRPGNASQAERDAAGSR